MYSSFLCCATVVLLLKARVLFVATRPLLRQIENLQRTYAAQTSSYEKVERNLTERLSESL